jgi:hypothetical protein
MIESQNMEQAISSFFRTFELVCNSSAPADAARAFAENFLYADGEGAKVLPRAALAAGIGQRGRMMEQAGYGPSVLERLDTELLDDHYARVTTVWRIDPVSRQSALEPIYLRATYLVEVRDGAVQILAYFSHTNLRSLVQSGGEGKP